MVFYLSAILESCFNGCFGPVTGVERE